MSGRGRCFATIEPYRPEPQRKKWNDLKDAGFGWENYRPTSTVPPPASAKIDDSDLSQAVSSDPKVRKTGEGDAATQSKESTVDVNSELALVVNLAEGKGQCFFNTL